LRFNEVFIFVYIFYYTDKLSIYHF